MHHLGAHADAPFHYSAVGRDIASQPLETYFGPAQVVSVTRNAHSRIFPCDYESIPIVSPRVLFKTGSFPNPDNWNADFMGLSYETVQHLAKAGVILIGIDTPSVDLSDDPNLECHQALLKNKISVLEGLDLRHVEPGEYTLIAFPLRIRGAEASPVRAVLCPCETRRVEAISVIFGGL